MRQNLVPRMRGLKLDEDKTAAAALKPEVAKEDPFSTSHPHNPSFGGPQHYTAGFKKFMDTSPTTFHAVKHLAETLDSKGFTYLSEREVWDDKIGANNGAGRSFYTTRNGSALVAVNIGENFDPKNGAAITAAHIDALTLKVKPVSTKDAIEGYRLIGVAAYAGALSSLWFDRDLGIGGRLIVRDPDTGAVSPKLVRIPHPVGIIPTLAPHFGTPANPPFNPETQMVPILGLLGDDDSEPATAAEKSAPLYGKHDLEVLRAIASEADVALEDIIQADLEVFSAQPAEIGGLKKDLLFCPRIDDKLCSYATFYGLLESVNKVQSQDKLTVSVFYDNEEVGSLSRQGAQSNILESALTRILCQYGADEEITRVFWANSFLLSSDVIHAVNPNFANVYLEHHKPRLNVGVTISWDPNAHMTTDAVSAALVEEVARRTGNKVQYFQIRNDSRSGGTVGPYVSSKTGLRAIDIGIAQLSMHSIRATTGARDVWLGVKFYKGFFEHWGSVDAEFKSGDL